jgi:hypothetical protein
MWAVIALVVACVVAAVAASRAAAGPVASRESPWDLTDNARKMVTVAGGLGAFSITGVVLLLSFAREPSGELGDPLTSAVGMFLVAYMSFVAAALMYATLTRSEVAIAGANVQTLQYTNASVVFFRSVFLSWLALRPLVEAYGFDDLAKQIGWLLLTAVLGGWALTASVLYRLALVRGRVAVVVPLLAFLGCAAAALVFAAFPGARSETSALYLSYVLFALNVFSFILSTATPTALEHPRLGPLFIRTWGAGAASVAVFSSMTLGFIWLATAGLI